MKKADSLRAEGSSLASPHRRDHDVAVAPPRRGSSRTWVAGALAALAVAALVATRAEADTTEASCNDASKCPADVYRTLRESLKNEKDEAKRESIQGQMKELEQRIALVSIHAECDGAEPFTVTVDGKTSPPGGAIPLAPGKHDFALRCPKAATEKTLIVGQRDRVDLDFPADSWHPLDAPGAVTPSRGSCGCSVIGKR